jgi:peptidoglycan/LPS O-acetylase OafA/YrhL
LPFSRLGHRPALDGLRGLAFLMVFVGHAGLSHLRSAETAMFLFFGLSGFLITATLLGEREVAGRVRLRRFFARRALRLGPALVAFLAVWLTVALSFSGSTWLRTTPGTIRHFRHGLSPATSLHLAAVGLAYQANWYLIYGNESSHRPLTHLWSLSVEEQFYVLWAPLLACLVAAAVWISRRRNTQRSVLATLLALPIALGAASLAEAAARLLTASVHDPRVTYGTDTRAGAFLAGSALAVLSATGFFGRIGSSTRREGRVSALAARHLGTVVTAGLLAALLLVGRIEGDATTLASKAASFVAASIVAPFVVAAVAVFPRTGIARALATRPIRYVGTRSYALYLWHYPMLTWLHGHGLAGDALALAASFAAAEASWRLVELPALRLRQRFEPVGAGSDASRAGAEPASEGWQGEAGGGAVPARG